MIKGLRGVDRVGIVSRVVSENLFQGMGSFSLFRITCRLVVLDVRYYWFCT